jgi:hypothetical protein
MVAVVCFSLFPLTIARRGFARQENSAFFVTTNSVEVVGQRQCNGTWPEDPLSPVNGTAKAWACSSHRDCVAAEFQSSRNGAVAPECNFATGLCNIYGWGPVELIAEDDLSQMRGYRNQLNNVVNFTVYIKNNIYFPKFNFRVRCVLSFRSHLQLSLKSFIDKKISLAIWARVTLLRRIFKTACGPTMGSITIAPFSCLATFYKWLASVLTTAPTRVPWLPARSSPSTLRTHVISTKTQPRVTRFTSSAESTTHIRLSTSFEWCFFPGR